MRLLSVVYDRIELMAYSGWISCVCMTSYVVVVSCSGVLSSINTRFAALCRFLSFRQQVKPQKGSLMRSSAKSISEVKFSGI